MNVYKNISKILISFFILVSIIVTSTSVFAAEIVGTPFCALESKTS